VIVVGWPSTLFAINDAELYKGPKSECWASNQLPFYGVDNILYCPNTMLVSSTNFTITSTQLPRISLFDGPPPMRNTTVDITGTVSFFNNPGEDEYWSFNFNKGTFFNAIVTSTQGTVKLYFQNKKVATIEQGQSFDYQTTV